MSMWKRKSWEEMRETVFFSSSFSYSCFVEVFFLCPCSMWLLLTHVAAARGKTRQSEGEGERQWNKGREYIPGLCIVIPWLCVKKAVIIKLHYTAARMQSLKIIQKQWRSTRVSLTERDVNSETAVLEFLLFLYGIKSLELWKLWKQSKHFRSGSLHWRTWL